MMVHPLFYDHCMKRIMGDISIPDQLGRDIRASLVLEEPMVVTELVSQPRAVWLVPPTDISMPTPKIHPYRVALLKGDYSIFPRHTLEEMARQIEALPDRDHYHSVRSALVNAISKK